MSLIKVAAIKIKKSHAGFLHKDLGVEPGERITDEQLQFALKQVDNPLIKRRIRFAIAARKWLHR